MLASMRPFTIIETSVETQSIIAMTRVHPEQIVQLRILFAYHDVNNQLKIAYLILVNDIIE
jgi:hypothetical protein